MNIKASNVTINVKDLKRSIAFYESIGFALVQAWGDHYAQLSAPGITIGLHPTIGQNLKGDSGNVSIGFTTDRFAALKSELQNLFIEIIERQEEGGQFLHFKDPDGTALYFINPKW